MKFLLTSAGIKNDSIRHALVDLLGCKSQHYSAHGHFGGLVPACHNSTATVLERWGVRKDWTARCGILEQLENNGA